MKKSEAVIVVKAAMNAAHYLGGRPVAMDARPVPTLFEVEARLF